MLDYYTAKAAIVFDVKPSEVTPEQRAKVKQAELYSIYSRPVTVSKEVQTRVRENWKRIYKGDPNC